MTRSKFTRHVQGSSIALQMRENLMIIDKHCDGEKEKNSYDTASCVS